MKRLSYILLAAMLVAALAVSCTAEVIDDSLVAMVRFTENSGARALEVSREDISVGTLYWKYDAVKVSGPASGAVTGKYLGQGLSNEAGPFSLGDWNFTLYGYKDKECKTLMYKGTGTGTVEKDKTNTIRISVEPQMSQNGKGSLHISKSIQLTKDGVVVKGSDGEATYKATHVVVTRLSNGEEVVTGDTGDYWTADVTSGSYKVVVSFVDAATEITHAENTVYVNVFDGLTTVISGTLDEVTSSISFDADVKEGRISETKTVTPDTETGNVSASFGFSPVSNESSTGNDVLGTTIEGAFTGSGSIELNVYGSEGASRKFAVENENSVVSAGFDINLSEGLTVNGEITITTYIQPGLTGTVNVVYRDEEGNVPEEGQPTVVSYEVETGKLVFTTTHFSEYYVVSDSVAENATTGKKYATLQDAVDYARDGEKIKLLKNVDTVESLVFSNGTRLVLDLNGNTVKNVVKLDPMPHYFTVVSIDNESSVTLKNGTIQAMDKDCYAVNIIDGNLVIESGKYIGNVSVVQVQKGTLEIQDGEFSLIQTWPTTNDSTGCLYTINCIDANYNDGSAIVSIKGGTFRMFNPQDCYAEGEHTNFVAEGYVSERKGDYYVVRAITENDVAVVDGVVYSSLKTAVEAAEEGQTIALVDNVVLQERIKIGKTVSVDLNGYKLSADYSSKKCDSLFIIEDNGCLSIDDRSDSKTGIAYAPTPEKQPNGRNSSTFCFTLFPSKEKSKAKLSINGGNYEACSNGAIVSGNGSLDYKGTTEIVINDGYLKADTVVYHPQRGTLKVTGGRLEGGDSAIEMRAGSLIITGGEFSSSASPASVNSNGNGSTTSGSAIAVAQHRTRHQIEVCISGGKFSGYHAMSVMNPEKEKNHDYVDFQNVKVEVTGGAFTATGSNDGSSVSVVNTDEYFAISENPSYGSDSEEANFIVSAKL